MLSLIHFVTLLVVINIDLIDYEDDYAFQAKAKSEKGSHENIFYLCYSTLEQFLDKKKPYCIICKMEMTLEIFIHSIPRNLICKPASGTDNKCNRNDMARLSAQDFRLLDNSRIAIGYSLVVWRRVRFAVTVLSSHTTLIPIQVFWKGRPLGG